MVHWCNLNWTAKFELILHFNNMIFVRLICSGQWYFSKHHNIMIILLQSLFGTSIFMQFNVLCIVHDLALMLWYILPFYMLTLLKLPPDIFCTCYNILNILQQLSFIVIMIYVHLVFMMNTGYERWSLLGEIPRLSRNKS